MSKVYSVNPGAVARSAAQSRVVTHGHQTFKIDGRVASSGKEGAKLPGGLPPVQRDNNKAFNAYAPVFGVRQAPWKIGSTGGQGVVVRRTVRC
jgi:hypothetical protein